MGSQANQLHFVLFPFLAQGHLLPMVDIARLLTQHGVVITIFNTPVNAARFKAILACAISSGLQIRAAELEFPCREAGLPDGCEAFDLLPSMDSAVNFFKAVTMLQLPAEKLLEQITPPPSLHNLRHVLYMDHRHCLQVQCSENLFPWILLLLSFVLA